MLEPNDFEYRHRQTRSEEEVKLPWGLFLAALAVAVLFVVATIAIALTE